MIHGQGGQMRTRDVGVARGGCGPVVGERLTCAFQGRRGAREEAMMGCVVLHDGFMHREKSGGQVVPWIR